MREMLDGQVEKDPCHLTVQTKIESKDSDISVQTSLNFDCIVKMEDGHKG